MKIKPGVIDVSHYDEDEESNRTIVENKLQTSKTFQAHKTATSSTRKKKNKKNGPLNFGFALDEDA